jgi:uridine kinase
MHQEVTYPQIIFLAGASGSGKTTLAKLLSIPQFNLDHFYRDDSPELPKLIGKTTDWDLPEVWDHELALEHLLELIKTGKTSYVKYDMVTAKKKDKFELEIAPGTKYILCEGIFSYLIIPQLQKMDLCTDIIWLSQNRRLNTVRRLKRDLRENRASKAIAAYRSTILNLRDSKLKKKYLALDARVMNFDSALRYLSQYTN